MTHPKDMEYDDYDSWVRDQPTVQLRIMSALCESRYISNWFPPYSSGAGDMIHSLIRELKAEWKVEIEPGDEWE